MVHLYCGEGKETTAAMGLAPADGGPWQGGGDRPVPEGADSGERLALAQVPGCGCWRCRSGSSSPFQPHLAAERGGRADPEYPPAGPGPEGGPIL